MNGNHNSHVEILLGVIRNLLEDTADVIEQNAPRETLVMNYRASLARDYKTIESRTRKEGMSFLTITLPRLGKWYDRFLTTWPGHPGELPLGFKPYQETPLGSCPVLLHSFVYVLSSFASHGSDPLLDGRLATIIRAYRSMFYLFYKLELPFSDDSLTRAMEKWKSHEVLLQSFDYPDYYDIEAFDIREIISQVIGRDQSSAWVFRDIAPRHGPGAVAGGEVGDEKWETRIRFRTLHSVYPWYDLYYGFRNAGRLSLSVIEQMIADKAVPAQEHPTSRLLFVPKDSRGPRTISCEPAELMFVQQGVARNMMKVMEAKTHNRINFVDQRINMEMAKQSSLTRLHATVDLEAASDSISTRLVDLLWPEWSLKYLRALRSYSTLLPNGEVVTHQKYAPMGSAICFPLESLTFWAIAVYACVKAGMDWATAKAETYVYGDDIIIPSSAYPAFVGLATRFAIKVNLDKSFVEGSFRESCGMDAYHGHSVTPLRIKKLPYFRSRDGNLAIAVLAYCNSCFSNNYRKTGEYLASQVESVFGSIPRVQLPIGCLHIVDPANLSCLGHFGLHYCIRSCNWKIRGWVVSPSHKASTLSGLSRLLKNHYGHWEEHDPSLVVVPRAAKTRKRDTLVEGYVV